MTTRGVTGNVLMAAAGIAAGTAAAALILHPAPSWSVLATTASSIFGGCVVGLVLRWRHHRRLAGPHWR